MGIEIERKYLVNKAKWEETEKGEGQLYWQGYLSTDPHKTIRVRLTGDTGFLTIKGLSVGASRPEYEYLIPKEDASELLDRFCTNDIRKLRYKISYGREVWEVDEFLGDNKGLIIAEIELSSEQEAFHLPGWIEQEVTGEKQYYNSYLSLHPFKSWKE